MNKFLLVSTAIAISSTAANAANDWPYWYLGLSGGANYQTDGDWDVNNGGGSGEFNYRTGWIGNASLGYKPHNTGSFFDSTRVELEGSYRSQSIDGAAGDSYANSKSGALNLYYDFAPETGFNPYLGAGLGIGVFDLSSKNDSGISGKDTQPIYQIMAGAGFTFEELPHTEWTIGYRYFAPFSDPETSDAGNKVTYEYDSHSVEVGGRFRF